MMKSGAGNGTHLPAGRFDHAVIRWPCQRISIKMSFEEDTLRDELRKSAASPATPSLGKKDEPDPK